MHLDHHVVLEVILKALELELQDWRKVIEQHPFAGILQHKHLGSHLHHNCHQKSCFCQLFLTQRPQTRKMGSANLSSGGKRLMWQQPFDDQKALQGQIQRCRPE